jgi:hypothetical protein
MVEGSQMSVKFNVTGSTAAGTLGPETRVKPDASTSKVRSMVAACAIEVNAAKAAPATKAWNFIVAPKQLSDGCAAKLRQFVTQSSETRLFLQRRQHFDRRPSVDLEPCPLLEIGDRGLALGSNVPVRIAADVVAAPLQQRLQFLPPLARQ